MQSQNFKNFFGDNKEYINSILEEINTNIENFKTSTNTTIENFETTTNNTIEQFKTDVNTSNTAFQNDVNTSIENLEKEFQQLKNYVDNYFENLDLTTEISKQLQEMVLDGTLANLVANATANRDILIIADSYTAGIGEQTQLYCKQTNPNSTQLFYNYVDENVSLSNSSKKLLNTVIEEWASNIPDTQLTKIGKIIYLGGHNELRTGTVATMTNTLKQLGTWVKSKGMNASIIVGCVTSSIIASRREIFYLTANKYQQACGETGAIYLTNSENWLRGLNAITSTDIVDTNGKQTVARALSSYINYDFLNTQPSFNENTFNFASNENNTLNVNKSYVNGNIFHLEMSLGCPNSEDELFIGTIKNYIGFGGNSQEITKGILGYAETSKIAIFGQMRMHFNTTNLTTEIYITPIVPSSVPSTDTLYFDCNLDIPTALS